MNEPQKKPSRLSLVKASFGQGENRRGPSATSEQMIVAVDNLVEDPKNERKTFKGVEELAASIKEEGLIEPLTVTPMPNGKYLIVTGHRRFRAVKHLGLEKIEVLVRAPEDDGRRRVKSLISNIQREDVPAFELAEGIQTLITEHSITQGDIAKKIGKTKAWVSDVLSVLGLPDKLRKKVQTSELTLAVDSLTRIVRIQDPQLQEFVFDALLSGATVRQIRELIREVTPEPKPAKKGAARTVTPAKPKRVYTTEHKAVVIVQGTTGRLTSDQAVAALQEALKQAKAKRD